MPKEEAPKKHSQLSAGILAILILWALSVLGSTSIKAISLISTSTPFTSNVIEANNISKLTKLVSLAETGVGPAWSRDGKKLAILEEKEVLVFDVDALGKEPKTFLAEAVIDTVVFSSDGTLLAAGNRSAIEGDSSQIIVWDMLTGKQKLILKKAYAPAFSPNSQFLLASASDTGGAILWNLAANKIETGLEGSRIPVFSADGKLVAAARFPVKTNTVALWKVSTNTRIATLQGKEDGSFLESLSFSPNGQVLAAGEDNGSVRLWDLNTLKPLPTLPTLCAQNVNFGTDETTLITWIPACEKNDNVQLWQFSTRKMLWGLHDWSARSVTISPNGSLVMIEDDDQTIFLDAKTGKQLLLLPNVTQPSFNSDGSRLVTSSPDGIIQIWGIS